MKKERSVHGGRYIYGQLLGILLMNRVKPRLPGDVGNALTFPFPVQYSVIESAFGDRARRGSKEILNEVITKAQELERAGVKAITSSCGYLIRFQEDIQRSVSIPVFMSSLLQIPLITKVIGRQKRILIVVADSECVDDQFLRTACLDGVAYRLLGLNSGFEFKRYVIDDAIEIYPDNIAREIESSISKTVCEDSSIGAILLECAQFPPFAKGIQEKVNLPVFDLISLCRMMTCAVARPEFKTSINSSW